MVLPKSVRGKWHLAVCVALLVCSAQSAIAGSFQVTPIRIDLAASQPVVAMEVRNNDSESSVIQVIAKQWTQKKGDDVYDDTGDIIASPPQFILPAGGTQVVRVGLGDPRQSTKELAYRVFLREVPQSRPQSTNLSRITLNLGVPVFLALTAAHGPDMAAALRTGSAPALELHNLGDTHVKILSWSLIGDGGDGKNSFSSHDAGYVLSNGSHVWPIKADLDALKQRGHYRLTVHSDRGDIDLPVTVEPSMIR